jgi:hypothetical protein
MGTQSTKAAAASAATSLVTPFTIISRGPASQIRVGVDTFKGKTSLNVREYRVFGDNTDFMPTKHGFTVPPELVNEFLAAVTKHAALLPTRVVDVEAEQVKWFVGKSAEDAILNKKHVYGDLDAAKAKEPPDDYKLFRVTIANGAVIKQRALFVREAGAWKELAAPAKKEKSKTLTGSNKKMSRR